MFSVRLRSGIILMAVAILLLTLGGPVMLIGTLLVSLIGMYELYRIPGFQKKAPAVISYIAACLYFALVYAGRHEMLLMCIVLYLIVLLACYVLTYPRYDAPEIMMAFFGLFYVAVMISYMYRIRVMENGEYLVWLVFISSWGCDTCAYCTGMLFGKHKMAPVLSPKKSVEGGIGGVVGAGLIGLVFAAIFRPYLTIFENPLLALFIIGAVGGLISMVGDLAASAIKRYYGIKDYGTLIPGHGGILDRFDSVIITAPLVYYLILALQTLLS